MATNSLGASKGAGVPCPRTTNTTTHQRARVKPVLSTGSPRLPLHAGNRPSSAPLSYSRRARIRGPLAVVLRKNFISTEITYHCRTVDQVRRHQPIDTH